MAMSYDPESGAAYIAETGALVAETIEIENAPLPFMVVVDLDSTGKPTGVELIGTPGASAHQFLSGIADGSLGKALARAGYGIRKLENAPDISVRSIS